MFSVGVEQLLVAEDLGCLSRPEIASWRSSLDEVRRISRLDNLDRILDRHRSERCTNLAGEGKASFEDVTREKRSSSVVNGYPDRSRGFPETVADAILTALPSWADCLNLGVLTALDEPTPTFQIVGAEDEDNSANRRRLFKGIQRPGKNRFAAELA